MKIHNPNKLPTIDYRKVLPLQGDLKDLSEENGLKLKGVLEKRGFKQPLNLWKKDDGQFYLMDGHQRLRVLQQFDMNDDGSYDLPYFLTEAENEQEAKAQLLEITSQYGTITYDGLDQFIAEAELPEAEVFEAVHFDALNLMNRGLDEKDNLDDKPKELAIKITFKTLEDLENCLVEIQNVCENYEIKGISVNDKDSRD